MCSAWVLCGKEAEATRAPAICKQPARATTSATTVCSLRCPTIARSAPTMPQKKPRRWTNEKLYWNRKRQNHFLATRLVVVGGGSCRESMQGERGEGPVQGGKGSGAGRRKAEPPAQSQLMCSSSVCPTILDKRPILGIGSLRDQSKDAQFWLPS